MNTDPEVARIMQEIQDGAVVNCNYTMHEERIGLPSPAEFALTVRAGACGHLARRVVLYCHACIKRRNSNTLVRCLTCGERHEPYSNLIDLVRIR
jgi:hypothetical protein